ncbi:MAG: hypothetical protein MJA84_13915, partial [Firmicutes bacterium]|nr:hypothetical protein [Bacillota bacterium]
RAIGYFFKGDTIDRLMENRQRIQARRTLSDREFMGGFQGQITFEPFNRGVLRWLGNPLMGAYWFVVRRLIRW